VNEEDSLRCVGRFNSSPSPFSSQREAAESAAGRPTDGLHLPQDNASLRTQLEAQLKMLELRNDEKQHLVVELEDLKQDFAALENELEHATRAREKGNRSASGDEGVGREELEKVCSNFPCIRIPLLPSERSEFSTGGGTLTFILLHRT
jgi:hypothetical protein